jgi:hypothetical protein
MGQTEFSVLDLIDSSSLELFADLQGLSGAGGPKWMAYTEQSSVSIDWAVALKGDGPGSHIVPSFTFLAKTQFLHLDDLGNGKAVMYLGHINILWG